MSIFRPSNIQAGAGRWLVPRTHGGRPYTAGMSRSIQLETVTDLVLDTTKTLLVAGWFRFAHNASGIERLVAQDDAWFFGYDHATEEIVFSVEFESDPVYYSATTAVEHRYPRPRQTRCPVYLGAGLVMSTGWDGPVVHTMLQQTHTWTQTVTKTLATHVRKVGGKCRFGGGLVFGGNYGESHSVAIYTLASLPLMPGRFARRWPQAAYFFPFTGQGSQALSVISTGPSNSLQVI